MKTVIAFVFLIIMVGQAPARENTIPVFVSILPQKQFVEKIGGKNVDVHVMLPPGESPETYSPSPKMLVLLSSAHLYFQIGVPFEKNWIDAIRSANKNINIIACCEHIISGHSVMTDAHDHHDLHIWSNPLHVKMLARDILQALTDIDPSRSDAYLRNYEKFITELDELDRKIQENLSHRRTDYFIVSHAAWGYFAERYGLEQVALETNNRESGPRSLSSLIRLGKKEKINTLFVQEQYNIASLKSLARELDAVIIELDPLAEDYVENMSIVSGRFAEALK